MGLSLHASRSSIAHFSALEVKDMCRQRNHRGGRYSPLCLSPFRRRSSSPRVKANCACLVVPKIPLSGLLQPNHPVMHGASLSRSSGLAASEKRILPPEHSPSEYMTLSALKDRRHTSLSGFAWAGKETLSCRGVRDFP